MKSNKITSLLFSLAFLLGMVYSPAQNNPDLPEKLYQDYKNNGIEKALNDYNNSPARGDEYTFLTEPLNVLGYRIMDEGDLAAAERVFLAQIDEYPNQANPYDSYADLLMQKGEEEKAREHYKKAIDLSATMEDVEEKAQMLEASKTKLAILEGAGSVFEFLEGTWEVSNYGYENGEKMLQREGTMVFHANENNTILSGVFKNNNGEFVGTRIIAYNAVDENYEMAWASNPMLGIEPSTIKVEKNSTNEVIVIEHYEEDGDQQKVKHVIDKASGDLSWDIYDLSNTDGKKPVASMTFKKKA